ncbi:MAG: SGNH/GDSL hydrolase family protein [Magnetococcales bacterium]|nr:SGNH/GDSL hydrolase family protein [Magnetococcales bacterium]
MLRTLKSVLVFIGLLPCLLLVLEGVAMLVLQGDWWRDDPATYSDATLARIYEVPPDATDSYRDMLRETWRQRGGLLYAPFLEFREADFDGKYIKVSPIGYRQGAGQQPWTTSRSKVFLFGGSTMFGYGVKSEETIGSGVQTFLDHRQPDRWAVFNFGAGSYYSTSERILFQQLLTAGKHPEIAVFMDGYNDFYFYKVPDETPTAHYFRKMTALVSDSFFRRLDGLVQGISQTFRHTRQLLISLLKPLLPIAYIPPDKDEMDATLHKTVARINTNHRMLRAICKELSIHCLFIVQPVPNYMFDDSLRADKVTATHAMGMAPSDRGYQLLFDHGLLEMAPDILLLHDLPYSGNRYVDIVHYSPSYNRLIAEKIVEALTARGYN